MRTIWKFGLSTGLNTVMVPAGAKILHVADQHGTPQVWAEVNLNNPQEPRTFEFFGTGHYMPETKMNYLGTCMAAGGHLVWHVYEHLPEQLFDIPLQVTTS